jgi:hypothetical protein
MNVKTDGYALPIEKALAQVIETELGKLNSDGSKSIVLNFRDPTYSATAGGYHSVEIMLNEQGVIQYCTDFSYVGYGEMVELEKELDFDFSAGILQQMGRCYPIEDAWELFKVWQQNFCAYYQQEIFQVSTSEC